MLFQGSRSHSTYYVPSLLKWSALRRQWRYLWYLLGDPDNWLEQIDALRQLAGHLHVLSSKENG
jgi:hypothetical protein